MKVARVRSASMSRVSHVSAAALRDGRNGGKRTRRRGPRARSAVDALGGGRRRARGRRARGTARSGTARSPSRPGCAACAAPPLYIDTPVRWTVSGASRTPGTVVRWPAESVSRTRERARRRRRSRRSSSCSRCAYRRWKRAAGLQLDRGQRVAVVVEAQRQPERRRALLDPHRQRPGHRRVGHGAVGHRDDAVGRVADPGERLPAEVDVAGAGTPGTGRRPSPARDPFGPVTSRYPPHAAPLRYSAGPSATTSGVDTASNEQFPAPVAA